METKSTHVVTAPLLRHHRLPVLRVGQVAGDRARGRLIAGTSVVPCMLGPNGITHRKREGDGATPAGRFALVRLLVRPDRGPPPRSGLPRGFIREGDGWCDDVRQSCYNRPIRLPSRAGHERMWREDGLYDAVVVLDYNLRPARKGRGSAIFMHNRASPPRPTAGCVALAPSALRRLLARVGPQTRIVIA